MKKFTIQSKLKRYPCLLYTDTSVFLSHYSDKENKFMVFRESALPAGLLINSDVADINKLGVFIEQLIKQSGIKEKHVIIGLPELKATTQSIKLPPMGVEETKQAVENQASSFLPFPLEEAYIDWQFSLQPEGEESTVLISAIPKIVINNHAAALQLAGLVPIAFETTAVSLSRLIPENAPVSNIAVNYTDSSAVVIINHNKSLEVSSVLQGGANLVDTIQRLLSYYLKEKKSDENIVIDTMYLSGKNITQQFVDQIKQQIKLNPVLLSANISNIPKERQIELAILSVLSKKDTAMPESSDTINLLPDKSIDVLELENQNKLELYGKYSVIILLLIFSVISLITLINLKNKTETLGEEVNDLAQQKSNVVIFNPAKIALIDVSVQESEQLLQLISTIIENKPSGIYLIGISYQKDIQKLIIAGDANDRNVLLSYKELLEKVDSISEVIIPLSSLEEEFNINFRIQVELET